MIDQISWIVFSIPSLLLASSIHEFSHAWAATKLGDYTAKVNGRLTLNPLAHIDPIGAIMMVIAKFGWSKPIPINEHNFKNPVLGTALTALAGPTSNLIVAIPAALVFRLAFSNSNHVASGTAAFFVANFLITFIIVNLSLAVFNLIPLPPLDGHKIVRAFLPQGFRYYWESLENYGRWILILLFIPFSPLAYFTGKFMIFAIESLLALLLFA